MVIIELNMNMNVQSVSAFWLRLCIYVMYFQKLSALNVAKIEKKGFV